ncbi:uncharacterized protein LOC117113289 isoform X2 [Anneissia japonica]|uniref:uncharacterized protein LOC117113289 isoform X2 n=1 Tax=Anneissia japonica TaxID=1529436 RepID=UPI0014255956|nr:uncharacterized protein LOC117113289 isoform X2 [Anneissia japonica]
MVDASNYGVGGVLQQKVADMWCLIAFFSRRMNHSESRRNVCSPPILINTPEVQTVTLLERKIHGIKMWRFSNDRTKQFLIKFYIEEISTEHKLQKFNVLLGGQPTLLGVKMILLGSHNAQAYAHRSDEDSTSVHLMLNHGCHTYEEFKTDLNLAIERANNH